MRLGRLLWLLVPWACVLACGGRFEKQVEGDDQPGTGNSPATGATSNTGGSTSAAGSMSKAGSVSRGGSTSQAGSSSRAGAPSAGSTSSGGRVGSGGTGTVGGGFGTAGVGACLCDPIGCAPPFREAPDADGCCSHCELDAKQCDTALHDYQAYRLQVIQKYQTLGCMSDSDCSLFFDKNQCQAGFCGAAILNSELMSITDNLNSYARTNCSFACPPPPQIACPPIPAPKCVMSHCQ